MDTGEPGQPLPIAPRDGIPREGIPSLRHGHIHSAPWDHPEYRIHHGNVWFGPWAQNQKPFRGTASLYISLYGYKIDTATCHLGVGIRHHKVWGRDLNPGSDSWIVLIWRFGVRFKNIPQTVLALRGSYGVGRECLWFLSGPVHGTRSLSNTVKMQSKWTLPSSRLRETLGRVSFNTKTRSFLLFLVPSCLWQPGCQNSGSLRGGAPHKSQGGCGGGEAPPHRPHIGCQTTYFFQHFL